MVNDVMGSSDDDDGDYELNQPVAESMPARYPVHDCVEFEDAEILRVRMSFFVSRLLICGCFSAQPLSAILLMLFLLLPIKIEFSARDMRTITSFFDDVFLIFSSSFSSFLVSISETEIDLCSGGRR